jgi:hypothetical protein
MNGKGDKPRPVNKTEYDKNYDTIQWQTSKKSTSQVKKKKGKSVFVYK